MEGSLLSGFINGHHFLTLRSGFAVFGGRYLPNFTVIWTFDRVKIVLDKHDKTSYRRDCLSESGAFAHVSSRFHILLLMIFHRGITLSFSTITTPTIKKYLHIFIICSILVRVSEGSLDTKSVSLPPINFFPNLYGYFKRPDNGIRKTRSEPAQPRKKIVKTFRSKVRFLPPIATLYPEKDQDEVSQL